MHCLYKIILHRRERRIFRITNAKTRLTTHIGAFNRQKVHEPSKIKGLRPVVSMHFIEENCYFMDTFTPRLNSFYLFLTKFVQMKATLICLMLMSVAGMAQSAFQKGKAAMANGDLKTAETYLKQHLDRYPNETATLELLGDVKCAQKDWESGVDYYEKLRDALPKSANSHYKYGGALGMLAKESNKFRALGMIPDVRSSFEKAIELDPRHLEARWALLELYLQLPGIAGGSESKARRYANELARLSTVDGHLAHGRIAEYFKRWVEAEKHLKKAVETGGSKTTYQKLADLYKKSNQPDKAKATMAEYSQKNKS